MADLIIHHNGAYNIFGTIMDAPHFESALTLDQLKEYIRHQQGEVGLQNLIENRLPRAIVQGCSAVGMDLRECLACNRASPGEEEMPYEEFITRYLTL